MKNIGTAGPRPTGGHEGRIIIRPRACLRTDSLQRFVHNTTSAYSPSTPMLCFENRNTSTWKFAQYDSIWWVLYPQSKITSPLLVDRVAVIFRFLQALLGSVRPLPRRRFVRFDLPRPGPEGAWVYSVGLQCPINLLSHHPGLEHVFKPVQGDHHVENALPEGLRLQVLVPITVPALPSANPGRRGWPYNPRAFAAQLGGDAARGREGFVDLQLPPVRRHAVEHARERPFTRSGAILAGAAGQRAARYCSRPTWRGVRKSGNTREYPWDMPRWHLLDCCRSNSLPDHYLARARDD